MSIIGIRTPDGGMLAGDHYPALTDSLDGPLGRPCVVMAHGVGATRDCGLEEFARGFARAGADVITFDYRNFAGSSGQPRQLVDLRGQLSDYRSAIAYARRLPGVDPERIAVWGVSLSGGHVLEVAAHDPHIAAVISVTPAVDGLAAVAQIIRNHGVFHVGRLFARGVVDRIGAAIGRQPLMLPIVARPGAPGALTSPGASERMHAIAGPTWRNTIAARLLLRIGLYRPARRSSIACPILMQIAEGDQSAPPAAAERAAVRLRATVRRYPADHFDVYPGGPVHGRVLAHQCEFLRRVFANIETLAVTA
ncbi:alpha/beta hydrolase fold protein [Mycolicibacterium rhodesiae JS60]|nr:alpha/beta hydrolase fold protein [Mycolicibacterium rhodesiae JS60]